MTNVPLVTAHLFAPNGSHLLRTFPFAPYDLQITAADVLRRGPGVRVELTVQGSDADAAELARQLACLGRHGIDLSVRVSQPASPADDEVYEECPDGIADGRGGQAGEPGRRPPCRQPDDRTTSTPIDATTAR